MTDDTDLTIPAFAGAKFSMCGPDGGLRRG